MKIWKLISTALFFLLVGYFVGSEVGGKLSQPQEIKSVERKAILYENLNPLQSIRDYRTNSLKMIEGLEEDLTIEAEQLVKNKNVKSISIYFQDLSNGNTVSINDLEIFSPASLMKVPVMIAILKLAENDSKVLSQEIEFKGIQENQYNNGRTVGANSTVLISGMRYSLMKLMEIMIDESDNEATILLLDFLDAFNPDFLNQVQSEIGLIVPDSAVYAEDFITVKQFSSFFRTLYNASYLNEEYSNLALSILKKSGYGFGIRQAIPVDVPIAHKFGHKVINENLQELHHFGLVYLSRKPFLLGVMTKGEDIESLKKAIYLVSNLAYQKASLTIEKEGNYRSRDIN